jgi:hypothetical protein
MRIFIFKSEAKPDLRAFGGDLAGSQLPSQFKPWRAVGAVQMACASCSRLAVTRLGSRKETLQAVRRCAKTTPKATQH